MPDHPTSRVRQSLASVRSFASAFAAELRLGMRSLARAPGFSAIGIVVFGGGIAAATLAYALIRVVLLEPLPYTAPAELHQVRLRRAPEDVQGTTVVPIAAFEAWRAAAPGNIRLIASDEARQPATMYLSGIERPEAIRGAFVSPDWFEVLGVELARGRAFREGEGGAAIAVIAHSLWLRALGGDPGAVGRTLVINGRPFTVVGILPARFVAPPPVWQVESAERIEAWAPMERSGTPHVLRTPPVRAVDHDRVLVRVPAGVPVPLIEAELSRLAALGAPGGGIAVQLEPLRGIVVGDSATALAMIATIVIISLLLTCANVAGIQFSRFAPRHREAAIRAALGGTRQRVVAHFVAEGLVLAMCGGALGLLLALWFQDVLRALAPLTMRRSDLAAIEGPVVAFTFVLTLVAGLLATVWPALAVASAGPNIAAPMSRVTERRRAQTLVVAGQLVLTLALLIGAAALVRSVARLSAVDTGIRHVDVVIADVHRRTDAGGAVEAATFQAEILRRIRAIPGVTAAALTTSMPFRPRDYFMDDGRRRVVTDGYFETLGIRVIAGRTFEARDQSGTEPVVVVSRAYAARVSDADPVGLTLDGRRVIGVVDDVRHEGADAAPEPALYTPLAQTPDARVSLVVRADLEPDALAAALRDVIAGVDPEQPVSRIATLHRILSESPGVAQRRFQLIVLIGVAAFAIALAGMGVYGVIAESVVQRMPEIGVRVVLGAAPRDVLQLVLAASARFVAVALVAGVLAGFALLRVLRHALFGITPTDPLSIVPAVAIILLAAALAAVLPARRALRIDPARMIRSW